MYRTPLSVSKTSLLRKLYQKKHRTAEGLFVAEGLRCINQIIDSGLKPEFLVFSEEFPNHAFVEYDSYQLDKTTFAGISRHQASQGCIAIFIQPKPTVFENQKKILLLDDIQDPGNVGTIIRTAQWFGVELVVLGKGCADLFNPKTISATSGAITTLSWLESSLEEFIAKLNAENVFGLSLSEGSNNLKDIEPRDSWALILGNEGNGISTDLNGRYKPVHIAGTNNVESLNVASSAAISLFHFCNF